MVLSTMSADSTHRVPNEWLIANPKSDSELPCVRKVSSGSLASKDILFGLLERIPASSMPAGQGSALYGTFFVTVALLITTIPQTSPAIRQFWDPPHFTCLRRGHSSLTEMLFHEAEKGSFRTLFTILHSFTRAILLRMVPKALLNSSKNISCSLPRPPGFLFHCGHLSA